MRFVLNPRSQGGDTEEVEPRAQEPSKCVPKTEISLPWSLLLSTLPCQVS